MLGSKPTNGVSKFEKGTMEKRVPRRWNEKVACTAKSYNEAELGTVSLSDRRERNHDHFFHNYYNVECPSCITESRIIVFLY